MRCANAGPSGIPCSSLSAAQSRHSPQARNQCGSSTLRALLVGSLLWGCRCWPNCGRATAAALQFGRLRQVLQSPQQILYWLKFTRHCLMQRFAWAMMERYLMCSTRVRSARFARRLRMLSWTHFLAQVLIGRRTRKLRRLPRKKGGYWVCESKKQMATA